MKLPNFRRLVTSDYPKEFQKLVDILSVSVNNGFEVLYEALNGEVTLRENIKCTVKDVTVTVSSNGTPLQSTAFTLNNTNKVDMIMVGLAVNQNNPAIYPTSQPFISGAQNGNVYNINNISGLQANQPYLLRLVAYQL